MTISPLEAVEVCSLVDSLRNAREGNEVVIVADNADFGGPECLVILRDLDGREQCACGVSVLACLRRIDAVRKEVDGG